MFDQTSERYYLRTFRRYLDARHHAAHRFAKEIKAGVWINTFNQFNAASPFGGFKHLATAANGETRPGVYTHVKSVWVYLSAGPLVGLVSS